MSNKKKIIIFAIALIVIAAMVFVNLKKNREKGITVTVEQVKRGDITQTVSGSGKIQPERDVRISARISAEIIQLPVREGQRVKKGALLVVLDRQRYEGAVAQYESAMKSAQANLKKAKADYLRIKDLFEKNLTSQADLDAADANLLLAEANVEQAEATLSQAKDDLDKTILRSPIDGVVTKLNKEEGEIALGSQFQSEVIMTIANLSKMEVVTEIDENDVVLINLGDKANIEVDALPDTTFIGTVREIAHSATTRGLGTQEEVTNFEVKVAIKSEAMQFRPGMSATVDIETETHKDVLYVPIQSVTVRDLSKKDVKGKSKRDTDEDIKETKSGDQKSKMSEVVFIVEGNKAKMVPVKTGISNDTHIEIKEGLDDSVKVVTGSFKALSTLLKDGSAVKVKKSIKPESN